MAIEVQEQQQGVGGSLLTIQQMAAKHPAFPVGTLRALRFNAKNNGNGFAAAFKGIGTKRVYVDERAFFACIDAFQHQQQARRRGRARTA